MPSNQDFALALYDIGAFKLGTFTLKSGLVSPFYIDLRLLVSHPDILQMSALILEQLIANIQYDRLAAIPYAALPIGVALSLQVKRPLIYPRKERKEHGTAQLIEGAFKVGERVLVIDDLITKGDSKIEAIEPLREAGLQVSDIAVLLDRQSGGVQAMSAAGITVHAALRLDEMLDSLLAAGKLDTEQRHIISYWLKENS